MFWGTAPVPTASSMNANANSPAAAGQRPSQLGYGSGGGAGPGRARASSHATARAIAAHGFNALNTSPNSTLTATSPTQKTTYTNVGAKLSVTTGDPSKPLQMTSASRTTPSAPAAIRTAALVSRRPNRSGRVRQLSPWSFGCGHSRARAANEASSTSPAPQANSHFGIGRAGRGGRPVAPAGAGPTPP